MVRPFALVALTFLLAGDAAAVPHTRCPNGTGFAELAFVDRGRLIVVDMPGCNGRVLVGRGVGPPVRWSSDGRYISFSGGVIHRDGGRVFRGLGGIWSPRGHTLARITQAGGVVLGGPGLEERPLVDNGFGAQSIAFDSAGTHLAVGRARPRGTEPPADRELWVVDVPTGARRLVYRPAPGNQRTPVVLRWGPSDIVLFRLALLPANSANLDGLPLLAVPATGGAARRVLSSVLAYEEFLNRCRGRVAITAGGDRVSTRGKRVVAIAPPRWDARDLSRDRSRSWIAPACSPKARWIAVSAGRNWVETRFGLERRSIWVLRADGRSRRRLTTAPRGRSDELPRWAADGRALLFVRTGPTNRAATAPGRLFVVRLAGGAPEPVADLGTTGNYYGRYGWAEQTDLFVPRPQSASR